MKRHLKTISLLISIGLLTLTLIWGGTFASSPQGEFQGHIRWLDGNMRLVTPEVTKNNQKLLEASMRLYVACMTPEELVKLTNSGITLPLPQQVVDTLVGTLSHLPLAGHYVDPFTGVIYIGVTEIKEEYINIINNIISKLENVRLELSKVKYTERYLRDLQEKILQHFTCSDIPITMVGRDVINNGLVIGVKKLRPHHIETIKHFTGNDVHIKFIEGELIPNTSQTTRHRPLIGGVQIVSIGNDKPNTLGFKATRSNGIPGFVMTGHAGGLWTTVWQPTEGSGNSVGWISVNPHTTTQRGSLRGRLSDSAFVTTTQPVDNKVWPNLNIVEWRHWIPVGITVHMVGRTSGTTMGYVEYTGVITQNPSGQYLFDQIMASYSASSGDSGAPIVGFTGISNQVLLFGIHAGRLGGLSVFSPIDGIWFDLGLLWGP